MCLTEECGDDNEIVMVDCDLAERWDESRLEEKQAWARRAGYSLKSATQQVRIGDEEVSIVCWLMRRES